MKADYSRVRFNLDKNYSRVLQQQGRVTLDADWNEHVSIQADLDQKRLIDLIGACGVPYNNAGFQISAVAGGTDLNIAAGVIYVAGHRIQLNEAVNYDAEPRQPYLPEPPPLTAPGNGSSRVDLVYLCVRERHVTYLEDEAIREIALGGPDTSTRVQTIWQLRVVEDVALSSCDDDAAELFPPSLGAGLLTTAVTPPSVDDDPCVTPVDSGYRGLENRLYRVEVHDGGSIGAGASIKWSRYNGAVAFRVEEINVSNRILTLARLGWDQIVTLQPNAWIELLSEADELMGRPGALLQIADSAGAVNDAQRQVTLRDVANIGTILSAYAAQEEIKVRLWDSAAIVLTTPPADIELEDGIRIQLTTADPGDELRSGDYWTFTARTITGSIDILQDEPPHGPLLNCCKLALIDWNTDGEERLVSDCRPLFPPLTGLLQLHYAGGDGQEAMPGQVLAAELRVRVSRGEYAVANVPIWFRLLRADDGTLPQGGRVFTDSDAGGDEILVYTNADGLASCQWELGSNRAFPNHQVEAYIDDPADARRHQNVHFNARLSIAELVSYTPPADCPNLEGSTTVAEALDQLCNIGASEDPGFHVVGVFWQMDDSPAVHDTDVTVVRLNRGLVVVCDAAPDPESIKHAAVFVVLELPPWDLRLRGVQLAYILTSKIAVSGDKIIWQPDTDSSNFLNSLLGNVVPARNPMLVRLVLKGSKIWQADNPEVYLDGDVTSTPAGTTTHNLNLPSGDGTRGGDFEMWFNLVVEGGEPELDIFVVAVLHPASLTGFDAVRADGTGVTITDANAIRNRLNALDQAYDHADVVSNAGLPNYQPAPTAFEPDAAIAALREVARLYNENIGSDVLVYVQQEYESLGGAIIEFWNSVFPAINLSFNGKAHDSGAILDFLIDLSNEIASIVICDRDLLAALDSQSSFVISRFSSRV